MALRAAAFIDAARPRLTSFDDVSTYRLERTQLVPLSRRRVFSFFEDATNLERITPPFLGFRILSPLPIAMKAGTLIDYRIRLFGVPLGWRTRIDVYEPPFRFVDTQLEGPYRSWRHTHLFDEQPEGTLITDQVDYELGFGPLGALARRLFVGRTLESVFDYRTRAVAALLGG
jgi:ligand-binding SRPBCC domain-containing protein